MTSLNDLIKEVRQGKRRNFFNEGIVHVQEHWSRASTVDEVQRALSVLPMAVNNMNAEKASSLLVVAIGPSFDTARVFDTRSAFACRLGTDAGTAS
jgi:hypothetical protein